MIESASLLRSELRGLISRVTRFMVIAFAGWYLAGTISLAYGEPTLQINTQGEVTGVSRLNIEGTLYDVRFVTGTYNEVFGGALDFAGAAAGESARNAVSEFFNTRPVVPATLSGGFQQFLIPYLNPSYILTAPGKFDGSGWYQPGGIVALPDPVFVPGQGVTSAGDAMVSLLGAIWARFSASVVTGPEELLQELAAAVAGVGPGKSLVNKVAIAQSYLAVPDIQSACLMLDDFNSQVRAQRGKTIAAAVADKLNADAQAIMTAIGCN